MTKTIPAELQAAFPSARVIEFDDIHKGDVISWLGRGMLRAVGTAARHEGNAWRNEAGHALAWHDETNILIHRPKRELPTGRYDRIRLTAPFAGLAAGEVLAKGWGDWRATSTGRSVTAERLCDAEWEPVKLVAVGAALPTAVGSRIRLLAPHAHFDGGFKRQDGTLQSFTRDECGWRTDSYSDAPRPDSFFDGAEWEVVHDVAAE